MKRSYDGRSGMLVASLALMLIGLSIGLTAELTATTATKPTLEAKKQRMIIMLTADPDELARMNLED